MRVDYRADQPIKPQWQPAKDPLVERGVVGSGGSKTLMTGWINPEVINCFLLRVPGKFEPSQTFVFLLGASEVQFFCAVARQKLNALPHDKIIGAQCLKSFIRSAVFIKGVLSEAEEDRGGNWVWPMVRENNETETRPNDVLVNV